MNMNSEAKRDQNTIFCDIDGTIFKYRKFDELGKVPAEPIDGCVEKLKEWKSAGHVIILTTARPESHRNFTVTECLKHEVPYNQLVMNCGRGIRVLINDDNPEYPEKARAIALHPMRNVGFSSYEF